MMIRKEDMVLRETLVFMLVQGGIEHLRFPYWRSNMTKLQTYGVSAASSLNYYNISLITMSLRISSKATSRCKGFCFKVILASHCRHTRKTRLNPQMERKSSHPMT